MGFWYFKVGLKKQDKIEGILRLVLQHESVVKQLFLEIKLFLFLTTVFESAILSAVAVRGGFSRGFWLGSSLSVTFSVTEDSYPTCRIISSHQCKA